MGYLNINGSTGKRAGNFYMIWEQWQEMRDNFYIMARRVSLVLVVLALAAPRAYADGAGTHEATFSLYAPHAKSVEVVGDFNQWQSGVTPLAGPDEKGVWRVKLTLPAILNRVEYIYWVDGDYKRIDPGQPAVPDGFSGENNVLILP